MSLVRYAACMALVLCLGAGTAFAAGNDLDWKTVILDNNPNFTVDVPSAVGNDYLPSQGGPSGELMTFDVDVGGELTCTVYRDGYSDMKVTRDRVVAALAKGAGKSFCQPDKSGVIEVWLNTESTTSNGLPASYCAANIETGNNLYLINSDLVVAARRHQFEVQCLGIGDSSADAYMKWMDHLGDYASHMRQSLHLPADER